MPIITDEVNRNANAKKYRTPGTACHRRPRNAIYLNPSNTDKHEMKKVEIVWQYIKKKKQVLTEAETKGCMKCGIDIGYDYEYCNCGERLKKLRRDIVVLDTGEIIEIETDKQRGARHHKNITVIYV